MLNETLGIWTARMNVTSAIYVKPRDTLRFLTLRDAAANPVPSPRASPDVDTWAGGKWLPAHVATGKQSWE
jgi:hypothetical protein